jgi:hypothetical protein
MPRYVIHFGPHKTGSTYLQLRFSEYRAVMAERGIVFPAVWEFKPHNPSQLKLVEDLRAGNLAALEAEFAALNASAADIVLISAEDLANCGETELALLKRLTAGNEVRLVFYLRRWSGRLPSIWQEGVKQGAVAGLPQFLMTHLIRKTGSGLLDPDTKLQTLAGIFGRDAIRLVCYDMIAGTKLDLFTHFAKHFLGWRNPPAPGDVKRANPSLDPVDIELIRVLNAIHQAQGGARDTGLRDAFMANLGSLDLAVPREAIGRHLTVRRLRDTAQLLETLQTTLSEKYLDLAVPPKPPDRLFKPGVQDLVFAAPEYLLLPGVVPALHAAHAVLFPRGAA